MDARYMKLDLKASCVIMGLYTCSIQSYFHSNKKYKIDFQFLRFNYI